MDLKQGKQSLLKGLAGSDWLVDVGIGVADGRPGLVVSVKEGQLGPAEAAVRKLQLDMPVELIEVGAGRVR